MILRCWKSHKIDKLLILLLFSFEMKSYTSLKHDIYQCAQYVGFMLDLIFWEAFGPRENEFQPLRKQVKSKLC